MMRSIFTLVMMAKINKVNLTMQMNLYKKITITLTLFTKNENEKTHYFLSLIA